MATLDIMIALASEKHMGQYDKGGNPYILHALKVMHYTRSEDPEIQMIAVGHDLKEDTDVTDEMLREKGFSERVIYGIDCMTKREGETQEEYEARVMSNRDTVITKQADLRHNSDIRRIKGLKAKDFQRLERYQRLYAKLKAYRLQEGF